MVGDLINQPPRITNIPLGTDRNGAVAPLDLRLGGCSQIRKNESPCRCPDQRITERYNR